MKKLRFYLHGILRGGWKQGKITLQPQISSMKTLNLPLAKLSVEWRDGSWYASSWSNIHGYMIAEGGGFTSSRDAMKWVERITIQYYSVTKLLDEFQDRKFML